MNPGLFTRPTGASQLEVVAIREQILPEGQAGLGLGISAGRQRSCDVAIAAPRQGDQALAGGLEPVPVHHRLTVALAIPIGPGHQPCQIAIAGLALAQQSQAARGHTLALAHQQIHPGDGLDPRLLGR